MPAAALNYKKLLIFLQIESHREKRCNTGLRPYCTLRSRFIEKVRNGSFAPLAAQAPSSGLDGHALARWLPGAEGDPLDWPALPLEPLAHA